MQDWLTSHMCYAHKKNTCLSDLIPANVSDQPTVSEHSRSQARLPVTNAIDRWHVSPATRKQQRWLTYNRPYTGIGIARTRTVQSF